jgi:hypothetical protein
MGNPAIVYDDASAFGDASGLGGAADGYDLEDLYTDAAALHYDLQADDASGAEPANDDYSGRDAHDLYEEAAALVEEANDDDVSQEWAEIRRSGDAGLFGGLMKKAKRAISKAKAAVSSVARTVAAPVASVAHAASRLAPKRLTSAIGRLSKLPGQLARLPGPLLPLAATVASFVPGAGSGVAAGLMAANALAQGKSLAAVALEAARGSLPGGPLAQQAFNGAVALSQGKSLTEATIQAARSMVPPEAQQAFDLGVGLVLKDKAAAKSAAPKIRRIAQRLVQGDARGLELDDAAALAGVSSDDAASAIASITGAVRRIARGGSPVLLREDDLQRKIRDGKLSVDSAVTSLGSYHAPWGSRERRGVPIHAGGVQRTAAAFEPMRLSALSPTEAHRLLAIPAIARMNKGALVRMISGADARGLTPDGVWYVVESSDYGLQQIATKLGHPNAEWKEFRDANLAPNGAKKTLNPATGSFTFLNAGDKLQLPASWVTVTAAPPPPAPPAGTQPVSITVPGIAGQPPVTIAAPPTPTTGGTPTLASYHRATDGGALPSGAKLNAGGATKIAHTIAGGQYPANLAKLYARPQPDSDWRDLRGVNPSKKLKANGEFESWPAGETVNIPNTWVTTGAPTGETPGTTTPPGGGGVTIEPVTPPAKIDPPKLEDVLPTPPKKDDPTPTPPAKDDPAPPGPVTPPGPGKGGESGGGGSSDYWDGYTESGAIQAKSILIRYLVEDAKTQTNPPLGTMPIDTTALWDSRAQEATRIFQRAMGFVQSGTPDDVTYQGLRAWNQARTSGAVPGGGTTPTPTTTPAKAAGDGGGVLALIVAGALATMIK